MSATVFFFVMRPPFSPFEEAICHGSGKCKGHGRHYSWRKCYRAEGKASAVERSSYDTGCYTCSDSVSAEWSKGFRYQILCSDKCSSDKPMTKDFLDWSVIESSFCFSMSMTMILSMSSIFWFSWFGFGSSFSWFFCAVPSLYLFDDFIVESFLFPCRHDFFSVFSIRYLCIELPFFSPHIVSVPINYISSCPFTSSFYPLNNS